MSGPFFRNKLKYMAFLRKRCVVNPRRGPFHFRAPHVSSTALSVLSPQHSSVLRLAPGRKFCTLKQKRKAKGELFHQKKLAFLRRRTAAIAASADALEPVKGTCFLRILISFLIKHGSFGYIQCVFIGVTGSGRTIYCCSRL
ncbi:hypothetical protein BSLG_005915 [Batrachochytrium salamandrivorans]|nr:hypothetical protein BSLG_005915 [Batrachochytrium salamandrivorans]